MALAVIENEAAIGSMSTEVDDVGLIAEEVIEQLFIADLPSRMELDLFLSVSYTHLDVYKRQELPSAKRKPRRSQLFLQALIETISAIGTEGSSGAIGWHRFTKPKDHA